MKGSVFGMGTVTYKFRCVRCGFTGEEYDYGLDGACPGCDLINGSVMGFRAGPKMVKPVERKKAKESVSEEKPGKDKKSKKGKGSKIKYGK